LLANRHDGDIKII